MRQPIMLALALVLSAPASAVTWEYALYSDLGSLGESWNAPEGIVTGKSLDEVLAGMKCDLKGLAGLLNCAGAQGWELVSFSNTPGQLPASSYVFKRARP